MKIVKVISGGQTGGDVGGLKGAKAAGIPTGGTAPRTYRTENGKNPELRDVYGLKESDFSAYPPRTEQNVVDSDVTVIFGNPNSRGCTLTQKFCKKHDKPCFIVEFAKLERIEELHDVNAIDSVLQIIKDELSYLDKDEIVLNVAGNRESSFNGLEELTKNAVIKLIKIFND